MTKAEIKAKARKWKPIIDKLIAEHQAIEEKLSDPDEHEEFVSIGIALGSIDSELNNLLD